MIHMALATATANLHLHCKMDWQFFFFPLQERYKNASNAMRSMDQQQTELSHQVTLLDLQLAEDPNRELLAQRKGLVDHEARSQPLGCSEGVLARCGQHRSSVVDG